MARLRAKKQAFDEQAAIGESWNPRTPGIALAVSLLLASASVTVDLYL